MKVFFLAATLVPIAINGAYAQQQPLAEIVLKVTPAELDLISEGLQTQPFGKVVPLINKLRTQFLEQQPRPQPVPAPEAPK